jgi:hypothetical protein
MEQHFDVSRIIGIKIVDKRETSHRWLPRKQKTAFFGLIKRNAYHSEGYYANGCYQEGYESGCWDAASYTKDELIEKGYLVEFSINHKGVYHRPYVTVHLEHEHQVTKNFTTFDEATQWAEELKATSGKTFEIVKYN